jgi:RluA family pseudouridine synthase
MRLLDFVASHLEISKKQIKRLIETNHCLVNQKMERFASTQVSFGDEVQFNESAPPKVSFQEKQILFEDPFLLIYNKPAGITCDPKGILQLLKPHGLFFLTHRLDKETSGALILAKSAEVEEKMGEAFASRQVKKEYLALVDGAPKSKEGVIENDLGKTFAFAGQTLYGRVAQGGKRAKTSWKLGKTSKKGSLIYCFPETGRTHQIRVHLSEMGHPILGDYQYGKSFKSSLRPARHMLHAYRLAFVHPMTGVPLKIQAPIPKDFQEVMKEL